MKQFHISRNARDLYQFDQSLFKTDGNVIFTNFEAVKLFAQKMNKRRDLLHHPQQAIHAGQLNGMGLIDEIMHVIIARYRQQISPDLLDNALKWLNEKFSPETIDAALYLFCSEFPPLEVYQSKITLDDYFQNTTQDINGVQRPNRVLILEELLVLWLANVNPAFSPFVELFDDTKIKNNSEYQQIIHSLHEFLDTQPGFGPLNQNLIDMLRTPARVAPNSIPGQLEYIRTNWGYLLGDYLLRLLNSLDFIKEEEKAFFPGGGPSLVPEFRGLELELERFTQDKDWMPNLVLLAKNAYVWLDQLSKKYQRPIHHLDEIPDEELDRLAKWGFTGLWLIGLWERSPASKRIKQLCGNPDAVASAYSLFDYQINNDLGGESALKNLQHRAWQRGIRLASDMVPNHMGIDSPWVIEHPNWFISMDYSPFPSYTFNGPDLSWNERVCLQIEDHYYDKSDAAVVFKRTDRWGGDTRYIYHGNDGTSMPWNDTAQLNFIDPVVREAVIQTILQIAQRFPIIRFDAAMTLTKKHFQRLWYPEPGSGGDIPSRAGQGMTKEQFNSCFPVEFWREVVDRINQELPDTLLLAEAFWLMEGYFVRTLGMHRVYNSAFMNMLRDEKNQEYRQVIKNTIEFDPEILKRFVNFMNNPDERTAVDQFGKDDKYFGICILMVTMPGLPMFGHGQVEGFTEKYGMEYQRAYWDEQPDEALIHRHEREIFPLMHRRRIFANVDHFYLYDFFTPQGNVNEDVFAYSNQLGEERALVVYHNKFARAQGWLRSSTSFPKRVGEKRTLVQTTLAAGLDLPDNRNRYVIFHDYISGLEYIRNCHDLHKNGLYIELDAYKYHVFLDFRMVSDDKARQYANLAKQLNGKGVANIDEALQEMVLRSVRQPFLELVNAGQIQWIIDHRQLPFNISETSKAKSIEAVLDEIEGKSRLLLIQARQKIDGKGDPEELARQIRQRIFVILHLPVLDTLFTGKKAQSSIKITNYFHKGFTGEQSKQSPIIHGDRRIWGILVCWAIIQELGKISQQDNYEETSLNMINEWKLRIILAGAFNELGVNEDDSQQSVNLIRLLVRYNRWWDIDLSNQAAIADMVKNWLNDPELQGYIVTNRYQGKLWFNKERFEELLWWFFIVALIELQLQTTPKTKLQKRFHLVYAAIQQILEAESKSGYEVDHLMELLQE